MMKCLKNALLVTPVLLATLCSLTASYCTETTASNIIEFRSMEAEPGSKQSVVSLTVSAETDSKTTSHTKNQHPRYPLIFEIPEEQNARLANSSDFIESGNTEAQTASDLLAAPAHSISDGSTSIPNNSVGRLHIPSVGVNVACYSSISQSVCDASDSAALFKTSNHTVIGDHVNQGFSGIKSCKTGTTAYISTSDGEVEYQCIAVIQGHNTGTDLTDSNYNNISTLYPGSLVMYTCNENSRNVTIAFFEPVSKKGTSTIPVSLNPSILTSYDNSNCNHSYSDWEVKREATETDTGYRTRTCRICNDVEHGTIPRIGSKVDADTHYQCEYTKTVYEPTCTQQGYTRYECDCGTRGNADVVPALGHDYTHQVIAPTTESGGYTLHTCTRCGEEYKVNVTDPIKAEPEATASASLEEAGSTPSEVTSTQISNTTESAS